MLLIKWTFLNSETDNGTDEMDILKSEADNVTDKVDIFKF